ncbi:MAG TPA: magnesium transporter [Gemmatimonadales bacterium]|nr:magnesium transporter [Gemmatimonadales bacterium]
MTSRAPTLESMVQLARDGLLEEFVERAHGLEPADLADVLASLDEAERIGVVQVLPPELSSQALIEMPVEAHAEDTLAALAPEQAAEIVEEMDDDDAADLLGELDPEDQERILSEVENRSDVDELLRYDEESAGGLMTTAVVAVEAAATASEALHSIRHQAEEVDFYQIYVVDDARHLVGVLPLKDLVVSSPRRPVRDFMEPADIVVPPDLDQEEVARLMARYNLPAVPVVDAQGRLLGQVTFDDVTDVVEAETTEDILQFGGTSADEVIAAGWRDAVRSRLPWLYINLVTAFVAGAVVYAYQGIVERVVMLAAWMPIIAGMGGNAGTQALAVTVRRLALGLIAPGQGVRIIGKEVLVGTINGLANGVVVAAAAMLLHQGPMMGLVVFLAMTGNLLVAGFAGAFIPLLLERFRVDPAIASSIFVTTFTDVCGFSLLLGLAGLLLL